MPFLRWIRRCKMAFIATGNNMRLPVKIAKIIQARNPLSTISETAKGVWVLEGPTISVYQSWFVQNNISKPWDRALYLLISQLSWGTDKRVLTNSFVVSDAPLVDVLVPLSPDLQVFISELSDRYVLDSREVIVGLLKTVENQLVSWEQNQKHN